jgi:hypothetical protein
MNLMRTTKFYDLASAKIISKKPLQKNSSQSIPASDSLFIDRTTNASRAALTGDKTSPIISVTYKFGKNLHATNHNPITTIGDDQAMTHAKIRYTTQTIHKLFCISCIPKKARLFKETGQVDHVAHYASCPYVQKSLRIPPHALNTPPLYHDLAAA